MLLQDTNEKLSSVRDLQHLTLAVSNNVVYGTSSLPSLIFIPQMREEKTNLDTIQDAP